MITISTLSWIAAFTLFQATPAPQDKKEAPKDVAAPPPAEPAITATLKDGVHFKSSDGNLDATLGGYLGIHYRAVAHRPDDNVRTSPDSWFLRQARIEMYGAVYKHFDFRIVFDVPTGNGTINTATLTDAYIGWRQYPELSLRIGQFKEPFGQEQTTPDRVIEFDERSLGDRFVPARDLGAMVYGRLFDGILGYEAGYFNGSGRGVVDTNKGKELAGRLRVMPFAAANDDFLLKNLRFGVAATTGTVQNSNINALDSTSPYLAIFYLDATAGTLDGSRKRLGGEFNWNAGPFGLRGELWRRVDHIDNGAFDNQRLAITAWNASATWLITGEKKPLESRVNPTNPFDPSEGKWGAVEAAFRLDRVKIGNEVFRTGAASATGNSNVATGYTMGINWFLTRHIRVSPNLFWEVYDRPILFSTGRTDRHFFGGILRFQLEF
jgi:phosphate-selective porin OprO/OprP